MGFGMMVASMVSWCFFFHGFWEDLPKKWPTRVNIFTKSACLWGIHHLGFELNTIHMDRVTDTSSGRVFNDEAQSEDEHDNLLFLPR